MHAQGSPARWNLDLGASVWDGPRVQFEKLNPTKIGVPASHQTLHKSQEKMKFSGKQVAAARELLGITQSELAEAAGVGISTIYGFEAGKAEPYPVNFEKIRSALYRRGIDFTNGDSPPSEGEGIGVRLNYARAAEFARTVR